jgi:hypothetical protein
MELVLGVGGSRELIRYGRASCSSWGVIRFQFEHL